ncbi:MAG: DUF1254 domain-containing protein [Steroidobacteraceae bacterium]
MNRPGPRLSLVTAIGAGVVAVPLCLADDTSSVSPRLYHPETADQFQWPVLEDVVPRDAEARRTWAQALAFDATLYGTVSVLQYRQMYAQAIARGQPGFTGFNVFAHDRELAGPGYAPFKSPNADTLYSNAWLDLSRGPVLFEVPDTAGRYYTANFLDMYGNATNISARTHGTKGGRYLIVPAGWQGPVPAGVEAFRVTTPQVWILLRILVGDAADVRAANVLQDHFWLTPQYTTEAVARDWPDGRFTDAIGFFRILDCTLRTNGHPAQEEALVRRYRGIGLAGPKPFDSVIADPAIRAGLEAGYVEARKVIEKSIGQIGRPAGAWMQPVDIGRYGFNYLYRATVNTLGTGSNVTDENWPFTTFRDAEGEALDGSRGDYELVLAPPPPVRFFWSVTVYDARTRELVVNPASKYLINDRTPGLVRGRNGAVTIRLQTRAPSGHARANWLPVPDGPFYAVIRAQGPGPELLEGRWQPPPIRRLGERDMNAAIFEGPTQDARRLAARAYVWGYPLVEAARIRFRFTGRGPGELGTPLNRFTHTRRLAGPEYRVGVGPNNDTIYSIAWVDLASGPFVLETPDFGQRYYTFSFNFSDSAAEESLGSRTHGGQLPPLFIQGPGQSEPVPAGMLGVRSTTRYLNIAGRILVQGPDEYPEVHALQDAIRLRPWSAYRAGQATPAEGPLQRALVDPLAPQHGDLAFLEMLGNVLKDWALEPEDAALVATFRGIGLTPQAGFEPSKLGRALRAEVLRGLEDGRKAVLARSLDLGIERNGWTTNLRGPRFGRDFLLRAAVAKDQIYVAIPEEAVYPIGRVDRERRPLDGRHRYRIRIPANDQPPVDAFWSITAYDDAGYMVENPIQRYSIGDRTRGLVRAPDGSIEILLQHDAPPAGSTGNWLPVPAARFYLMMRLYVPRQTALDGRWAPPAIEKIGR